MYLTAHDGKTHTVPEKGEGFSVKRNVMGTNKCANSWINVYTFKWIIVLILVTEP